jgi:hypothetical protein
MEYNSGKHEPKDKRQIVRDETIRQLWGILDDIDTASDVFKPEQTNFYKYIMEKLKERFKYITTDGYELYHKKELTSAQEFGYFFYCKIHGSFYEKSEKCRPCCERNAINKMEK